MRHPAEVADKASWTEEGSGAVRLEAVLGALLQRKLRALRREATAAPRSPLARLARRLAAPARASPSEHDLEDEPEAEPKKCDWKETPEPSKAAVGYWHEREGQRSPRHHVKREAIQLRGMELEEMELVSAGRRRRRRRRRRDHERDRERRARAPRRLVVSAIDDQMKVLDPDELPRRARYTIMVTACLLLFLCLLLVGVTLRMAPLIDDMGESPFIIIRCRVVEV